MWHRDVEFEIDAIRKQMLKDLEEKQKKEQ
jgi:hypothetical protein